MKMSLTRTISFRTVQTERAVAQDVLDGYFDVTGDPVLLPEYGFYLGHLNAYNRDSWTKDRSR